jgi:hypothetical protein
VLCQSRTPGDVDLANEGLANRRAVADEPEDDIQGRPRTRSPVVLAMGGGEHLATQDLRLLVVGRGEAVVQVAEVPVELSGFDFGADENLLEGHGSVSDLPGELEHGGLKALARMRSARISIGPLPWILHIDLTPARNRLLWLREGAA